MSQNKRYNAWISLTGRTFEINDFAHHDQWASDYLEKKWLKSGRIKESWDLHDAIDEELKCWSGYAHEVLEKWGWIRILDWGTSDGIQFIYDRKPNKRQLKSIFDICTDNNIPLPDDIFKI
jgi:hypothetical protein